MKKNLVSLSLACSVAVMSLPAQSATELRFATWMPPSHPINSVILPNWATAVEQATEGRVTVKFEYNIGGGPASMFTITEDGVVDAAWGFHGYSPGRFPLTQMVELPMLGANAEAASVAFWRVYNKYFMERGEFEGLEVAALCTHGQGQLHTKFPISTVDDLRGKKLRVGGGVQTSIAERLGVTPVSAPGPKIYELLQQGVVDGITMPISEQKGLRLNEVTSDLTLYPSGLYLGSLSVVLNPDFMSKLSDADRDAIRNVSGELLSKECGAAFDVADQGGLAVAEANGVLVNHVSLDSPLGKELTNVLDGIDTLWIEEISDESSVAEDALKELRQIAREYK